MPRRSSAAPAVPEAMSTPAYLARTKEVLNRHQGLWFNDEYYVIARSRDL